MSDEQRTLASHRLQSSPARTARAELPLPTRKWGDPQKGSVRCKCKTVFKTVFCSECGLTVQGESSKENDCEEAGEEDA